MSDLHEKRVEAAYLAWIGFPHVRGVNNAVAAIRTALEAADAVVAEEQVKWQYGLQDSDGFVSFRNLSLRSLRKRAKLTGEVIVRRRPATKWEEVSNDTE